ncbi:protein of unknown function [Methylorubrum extorquens]|uniref:Uncharacterized protein n=1 Tax=Methylorubrum extorquens TaxID=408 RepID=A0A2N9AXA8_METEX|nr:protein of unknown function [Methylorubrum extorquens]
MQRRFELRLAFIMSVSEAIRTRRRQQVWHGPLEPALQEKAPPALDRRGFCFEPTGWFSPRPKSYRA